MKYEKMSTRHLKAIVEIENRVYNDPWTHKQLRNMLPNENARTFVVVENNTLMGYLILFHNSEGWVIENLTVDEPFRRQGIGRELLALARQTVGSKKIRVYVADKYLGMHLLLKESGYRATKVEKADDEDYYLFETDFET